MWRGEERTQRKAMRTEERRKTDGKLVLNLLRTIMLNPRLCVLTAFSLPLQHQCILGSLQVIHHNVTAVEGGHHVGGVTTVEVH